MHKKWNTDIDTHIYKQTGKGTALKKFKIEFTLSRKPVCSQQSQLLVRKCVLLVSKRW